jgi:meso-butanediol dehydrogenase/(S,S)-butanediol dehydrogenase/diacetyl reductase
MSTPAAGTTTSPARFTGSVVVVTGAGRGLGLGIAQRYAGEGATVVLLDRDSAVVEVAAELDRTSPATLLGLACDVTDEDQVARCFAEVGERFGHLDVLVNNAGTITISTIEELTLEAWNTVLAVNTTGAFLCSKAALPLLRRSTRGRILNAASGQARQGFIYTPHYAASKFGVVGLTQSLAKELAKDQITVNAYCPGIVGTDMWAYNDREWGRLLGDYAPGELMAEWVAAIPLGRAGTNDDVANLLLFLGSPDASYITGQSINVDGGMFMS